MRLDWSLYRKMEKWGGKHTRQEGGCSIFVLLLLFWKCFWWQVLGLSPGWCFARELKWLYQSKTQFLTGFFRDLTNYLTNWAKWGIPTCFIAAVCAETAGLTSQICSAELALRPRLREKHKPLTTNKSYNSLYYLVRYIYDLIFRF